MKLRIVHLSKHCRFSNGNVHAAVDLAVAQAAAGHAVSYLSVGGDFVDFLGRHGVEHLELPSLGSERSLLRAMADIGHHLRSRQPQILHAHMMAAAVAAYPASRWYRTPLVTTVHNAFDRHAVLMRLGDRVICVSEAVREDMAARGFSAKALRVIRPGTVGAARMLDRVGPSDVEVLSRPAIGTLCGMHPRKGVDLLLDAFGEIAPSVPQAHLYVAGDGPYLEAYRAQALGLGLGPDRVTFLGAVHDIRSYLAQLDVFVLASRAEPAGLVITEAREAGCAVVASRVGGIPEMLDGQGVLFESESTPALVAALRSLLDDPHRLKRLRGTAGVGLSQFDIATVARQHDEVYRELVTPSPATPWCADTQ